MYLMRVRRVEKELIFCLRVGLGITIPRLKKVLFLGKVKVKQSRYRPGVAQWVPGN